MSAATDVLPVVAAADHVPGPPQGRWTYADWRDLPHDDGSIYEVLDGELLVSPPPELAHEAANARFIAHLSRHVTQKGLGEVLPSRTGVEIAPKVIVQPDVVVVRRENFKVLSGSHIVGAPDLVVEIASPSTATYDRSRKLEAYQRLGIPEYWIADPGARTVEVLWLEGGKYRSLGVFRGQATLPSRVIPDLPVPVEQFFADW